MLEICLARLAVALLQFYVDFDPKSLAFISVITKIFIITREIAQSGKINLKRRSINKNLFTIFHQLIADIGNINIFKVSRKLFWFK